MVGDKVGSYRVVRKIGEGGMGAVYEAVHEQIGRHVAIKVLHPEHSRNPEILARFHNEARAVNLVTHANLVDVYEIGQLADGSAYIVMQYLSGESLGERMQRQHGRLDRVQALRFIRQIASGMAAAHQKGIVHRDLKPNNVMLVSDPEILGGERVKVLDFGIAKVFAAPEDAAGPDVKTRAGTILGTPAYMSPEQARGAANVTDKADVYSLGVMLYEALVGRTPFVGNTGMELLGMHMHVPPPPIEGVDPSLPPGLVALVQSMLAKEPAARPSMLQVAGRLEDLGAPSGETRQRHHTEVLEARPRSRRLWLPLASGALLLCGLGTALWLTRGGVDSATPLSAARSQRHADLPTPMEERAPQPDLAPPADLATSPALTKPRKNKSAQPHKQRRHDDITDDSIQVVP